MTSSIKKLKKFQRDPKLFVKDMVIKRLGGSPANHVADEASFRISIADFEVVDGLIVIDKPDLVASMHHLKSANSQTAITIAWRTRQ